jgi:SAM-dependent methyltransferase
MNVPQERTRCPYIRLIREFRTKIDRIEKGSSDINKFMFCFLFTFSMRRGAYYKYKLSADRLFECYECAPRRIRRYLDAEIQFVISNVRNADLVLELGCGYGRVMKEVAPFASRIVGNDVSRSSLRMATSYLEGYRNYSVFLMDASQMGFDSYTFDAVFCIQNGVSAFGVDKRRLIAESIRITKENGVIFFSSYSPKVWRARLEWFRIQSQLGLIGEIDEAKTGEGTIICKDGFKATTVSDRQLAELFEERGLNVSTVEVDASSIFAIARKTAAKKKTAFLRSST